MKQFIKMFLLIYAILSIFSMWLDWLDLQSTTTMTGSFFEIIGRWLTYWLFWQVNYIVPMLGASFLLSCIVWWIVVAIEKLRS